MRIAFEIAWVVVVVAAIFCMVWGAAGSFMGALLTCLVGVVGAAAVVSAVAIVARWTEKL